ncbi:MULTISPECIES: alpha-galactosidase [unclassified Enterococcus]|uniref:alpha-galactosidase n=1 Tax=unclassified Enterococcus TaxID=2608891 RepID=UPI001551E958|nr:MULTISPECIES: alpha-galactosidase [unclassified Enterococcus]MBS7577007.1 alpha-galactosidase [Enterococcus sp. MMGLQ5-2]MBS7584546.1 alpha-galactosidase [Enterococcus sp. MMGLQ5-1]NPD12401.1 alpha-galactosidase [Enterococcus sp. MMGLQ5-1]NPD36841.1 alpha-galactosidase [Enterococcus sp. MMGLQ5-2]
MIIFNQQRRIFHLSTPQMSYVMQVLPSGHLTHLYWGDQLKDAALDYLINEIKRASYIADTDGIKEFKLERLPIEYPAYGNSDLRKPAFVLEHADGSNISDFRYVDFEVQSKLLKPKNLPGLEDERGETLIITLIDEEKQLKMQQFYGLNHQTAALVRFVTIENIGSEVTQIAELSSACIHIDDTNQKLLHLSGGWARELHYQQSELTQNGQVIESLRGQSSHEHQPFIALADSQFNEDYGEIRAMSLLYSGDFRASVTMEMHDALRLQIGLNPAQFSWRLEAGEKFETPAALLVYAKNGLQEMSQTFRNSYQQFLVRGHHQWQERPILINSWEAFYFDLEEARLLNFAKESADLGIELFVLDDGWFGRRDNASSSLGDWQVDLRKFPNGLGSFSQKIKALGLKFGLWVEPEMISPDSQLYRQHPEWVLGTPNRRPSLSRDQWVLDLTNPAVRDYLVETFTGIFKSAAVDYVKWDFNRSLTEIGSQFLPKSRQRETAHRYVLGLYDILERLTSAFPNVLFENCAGGGGRFDAGMTYYMPQTWASDDTDAIERLAIQAGATMLYPSASMGCHVSASPNHQNGRLTSLKTRGIVAMQGNFGYELDVLTLTEAEKKEIKQQVAFYKRIRQTVQFGEHYYLRTAQRENAKAWLYLSADFHEVIVSYVQILAKANTPSKRLRLVGLDTDSYYQIDGTEIIRRGDELMQVGLAIADVNHDFFAQNWHLIKQ